MFDVLTVALLAERAAGGPRSAVKLLLGGGRAALLKRLDAVTPEQAHSARAAAGELAADGIGALLCDQAAYPDLLRRSPGAPAVLFHRGPTTLLDRPAIGICGSRRATATGLRAARAAATIAAEQGMLVVSGHARGVDTEAHLGAVRAGGGTALVLPEGIARFRVRSELASAPPSQLLVLSQFAPGQRWTAGAAMTRNAVIVGLSRVLLVVEPGTTGGTLAAARSALAAHRPVLVLDPDPTPGARLLLTEGAHHTPTPTHLHTTLRTLPTQLALD